ncbi:MAG: CDP-alcohol phosphatidyltransferase family protein [Anaerolineaceae bacterium]|nr:CDP-alcohol phosphatidyltransferase family protein [Anaerolineaceae bacterium]
MKNPQLQPSRQNGMLSFATELPNICSLAGLLSALLGIYFAILGIFPAAIIGMLWAVVFDWGDGIIARQMKGRTDKQGAFGAQLDSLIDIVSFGVLPAVILMSYGDFSPWFLGGAFVILAVGVIRLSYFNVFGLVDKTTYMGLALDNNVLILALVFLLDGVLSKTGFSILIYVLSMSTAALNVAPIRTPKFTGKWFYVLIMYAVVLTAIYGWILWSKF